MQRLEISQGDLRHMSTSPFPATPRWVVMTPLSTNRFSDRALATPVSCSRLKAIGGNGRFFRRPQRPCTYLAARAEATFDREPGEPLPDLDKLPAAMQDFVPCPAPSLVSPFHLLTSASLQHMREAHSRRRTGTSRRFRPNLCDRKTARLQGLVEDRPGLAKQLRLGDLTSTAPRLHRAVAP